MDVDSYVGYCKDFAVEAMESFLKDFSHVPDDKLNWSPTPTSKSALRIAAHTSLYMARFAKMIQARSLPNHENLEAWLAEREAQELAIVSREEIEPIFLKGTDDVLVALDSLSPDEIGMTLDSGFGWTASMTWLMRLPGLHTNAHGGQIDFLQTCWDDQVVHF